MAINDSFNVTTALNSQSYAYKCWYNYNYGGNTMGISSVDMGKITQTWNGQLANWKVMAEDDKNEYEIDDTRVNDAKESGKTQAKDRIENETGFDGKADDTNGSEVMVKTTGAVAAAAGVSGIVALVAKIAKCMDGFKKAMGSLPAVIAAAAAGAVLVANAIWLLCNKPNKEAADACDAMQDQLADGQCALADAQSDMDTARENTEALAEQAEENAEDANKDIEKNKSEFDAYKATYDELMAKKESGQPLTEDEKATLESIQQLMAENSNNIDETQGDVQEANADIFDDMKSYQGNYDNAAETVAEVEGMTDFAASFDSQTEENSKDLKNAATIGMLGSAGVATIGAQGITKGFWQIAISALAIAEGLSAGVMYGSVKGQQSDYQARAATEIDIREETQDINQLTSDIYDESIADYEGTMTFTEELEIAVPKDKDDMDNLVNVFGSDDENGDVNNGGVQTNPTPDPAPIGDTSVKDDPEKIKDEDIL